MADWNTVQTSQNTSMDPGSRMGSRQTGDGYTEKRVAPPDSQQGCTQRYAPKAQRNMGQPLYKREHGSPGLSKHKPKTRN